MGYNKKYILNGIELKPGMSLCINENNAKNLYIIFPRKNELAVISYGDSLLWNTLGLFLSCSENKIVSIYDVAEYSTITGKLLWKKETNDNNSKETVKLSEIAKKFKIDINKIKIDYEN